jgi:glycosyltransferase involved in cell wall biosynthesis
MSYQLPIISTPVGGIPEAVIDKKNGFLINKSIA